MMCMLSKHLALITEPTLIWYSVEHALEQLEVQAEALQVQVQFGYAGSVGHTDY